MEINIDGNKYKIEVIRKNNKNTYIRVKKGVIYVSTSYLTSNLAIKKIIENNLTSVIKLINKDKLENDDDEYFNYFGKKYRVIYGFSETSFNEGVIYTSNKKNFTKYIDNEIWNVYLKHLCIYYEMFQEDIPKPNLKIRKMRSRWGVCNIKNHNVTLNYNLVKYDIRCLDYVIVHELSHFIYPNHSRDFWTLVGKYCPNYKVLRKKLRE